MRILPQPFALASGLGLLVSMAVAAEVATSDKVLPTAPPLPPLKGLRLEPAHLTLEDARDARRVLVIGERTDGGQIDLTSDARWTTASETLRVTTNGLVSGSKTGEGTVVVEAGGQKATLPVKVTGVQARPVGFVRDIEPILSKAGCSAGPCHGSAKGKNGFKLSLRGYDPEYDYQALINDLGGRRFQME